MSSELYSVITATARNSQTGTDQSAVLTTLKYYNTSYIIWDFHYERKKKGAGKLIIFILLLLKYMLEFRRFHNEL